MISKYHFSEYILEKKTFILKNENEEKTELIIKCNLDFEGIKFDKNIEDYEFGLFLNPYLYAQNDVFVINDKEADRTIGYIFPLNALIEESISVEAETSNIVNANNRASEYLKAFKFYSYKCLLQNVELDITEIGYKEDYLLSDLINEKLMIVIIYKPLVSDQNEVLKFYYPSLAIHGYYNYSMTRNFNFYKYIIDHHDILKSTIENHFFKYRTNKNITLKKCNQGIIINPIINILYNKFLPIADNPLYRFLLLYQFIEHFIDSNFRNDLSKLLGEINNLSSYEIFDELIELKKERKRINYILNKISFEDKNIIEPALKSFISTFRADYNKNTLGDYFYDIRNLLVHDYKTIIEKGAENELVPIIVLLEIVIHNLVLETILLETEHINLQSVR